MTIQPFPRKLDTGTLTFGAAAPAKHPDIALLVLRAISTWSITDQTLVMIAAKSMTADFGVVTEIVSKLTSSEAARSVIMSIVADKLRDSPDLELFHAISTITTERRKLRNKFAHWLWGSCPDIPTKIVLADPAAMHRLINRVQGTYQELIAAQRRGEDVPVSIPTMDKEGLYVLSRNGATVALKQVQQCHEWLSDFHSILAHGPFDQVRVEQLRNQLHSQSPIRDALSRRNQQGTS